VQSFKDSEGIEWSVAVNVKTAKRVKELCKVDLTQIDGDLVERFANDPCLACDVLFALVVDQAKERNVDDSEFASRMGGDVLERAGDVFMEELVAFFPSRTRPMLAAAVSKGKQLQATMVQMAVAKMENPETEALLMSHFEKTLVDAGKTFIGSPALSASTPIPSPSAN